VTLGKLVLAWILVGAWFGVATFATALLAARVANSLGDGILVAVPTGLLKLRLGEAGLLTLIASLWFDSLGSGEWWLLFLLIGALAGLPVWFRSQSTDEPTRARIATSIADLARYVVAGGLLAWRLS